MNYVSKSDYKVARTCETKLFYKKSKYPSNLDEDPYMMMLAEGGYMVGKLAQMLYPQGVLIGDLDVEHAISASREILARDEVVAFEPAIFHKGFLARVDVLVKAGNRFEIIEVKSKAGDSSKQPSPFRGTRGGIESGWKEYLEDITFQRYVLGLAYPGAQIDCFLLLPDKAKRTTIDNLPTRFAIRRSGRQIDVTYSGPLEDVIADNLLTKFEVNAEVNELLPEVSEAATGFLPLVENGNIKPTIAIGYRCKGCEFRPSAPELPSGFQECWGERGKPNPHVFDLAHLNLLNTKKSNFLVERLIADGKTSLYDVPLQSLTGAYAQRQSIQIEYSRRNEEWRSPQLAHETASAAFPLHFIDFETSRLALPYHRGMRPYELVAFQWSCHTIAGANEVPVHREWINLDEAFPNFEFVRQLRDAIGDDGTALMWSHFERDVLNEIAKQMVTYEENDPELTSWIQRLTADGGRLVDMAKICEEHFFHPEMKGKISIKFVLPAIWRANERVRRLPYFAKYLREVDGKLANPYDTLPALDIVNRAEVVAEGTGAMRAYQEMLYGEHRNNVDIRDTWRTLLLQYCELDTAAMVMIWKHWN